MRMETLKINEWVTSKKNKKKKELEFESLSSRKSLLKKSLRFSFGFFLVALLKFLLLFFSLRAFSYVLWHFEPLFIYTFFFFDFHFFLF